MKNTNHAPQEANKPLSHSKFLKHLILQPYIQHVCQAELDSSSCLHSIGMITLQFFVKFIGRLLSSPLLPTAPTGQRTFLKPPWLLWLQRKWNKWAPYIWHANDTLTFMNYTKVLEKCFSTLINEFSFLLGQGCLFQITLFSTFST